MTEKAIRDYYPANVAAIVALVASAKTGGAVKL